MRAVFTLIRVFRACTGILGTRKAYHFKARSLSDDTYDIFAAKTALARVSDVKSFEIRSKVIFLVFVGSKRKAS